MPAAPPPGPSTLARLRDRGIRFAFSVAGWSAFGFGVVLFGGIGAPIALLLTPLWPGASAAVRRATRVYLRCYVRTLPFARIQVEREPGSLSGPRILVANHQSFIDPLILIDAEDAVRGPARSYLFRAPLLGPVLRLLGFHDVDVGTREALARSARDVERARAEGAGLLFFPEGTRSRDGRLGAFQRGAFRIAVDHGLPIQPVVIEGMDRVLPPTGIGVRNAKRLPVRVRYLPAFEGPYGGGRRRDVVRGLCDSVRTAMEQELARMRGAAPADAPGPPRAAGRVPG